MRRRNYARSLSGFGIGVTSLITGTSVAASRKEEIETASKEEIATHYNREVSELLARWTDNHSYNVLDDVVELRWISSEYDSRDGWTHDFGLSSVGDAHHLDQIWGHEYVIGPPDRGDLHVNLNEGGLYPHVSNDGLVPSWIPPFIAPAVSYFAGSSLPGWLAAGGMVLREHLGADDDGWSGIHNNHIKYKKSNPFWNLSPLSETTCFCLQLSWESAISDPRSADPEVDIKTAFKMDTPVFEPSWEGIEAEIIVGDPTYIQDTVNVPPKQMTKRMQERLGIKRVDEQTVKSLGIDVGVNPPEYIATNPMITVSNTKQFKRRAKEYQEY